MRPLRAFIICSLAAALAGGGCAFKSAPWSDLLHPQASAPEQQFTQTSSRAPKWNEVKPEKVAVRRAPLTHPAPPQGGAERGEAEPGEQRPLAPAVQSAPKPEVTSAMNSVTRQQIEQTLADVDRRLTGVPDSGQVSVIRRLCDSAQQALKEGDYLTARSMAQKASVLTYQLRASAPVPTPSG